MAEDTNLKDMVEELNRKLREMEEAKKQQEIEMSRLKAQLSEASLKLRGSKSSSNAECFLEESSQQLNETELVTYELEEEVVLEEELPIHMSDMKTEITIEDMENEGTEDQQDKEPNLPNVNIHGIKVEDIEDVPNFFCSHCNKKFEKKQNFLVHLEKYCQAAKRQNKGSVVLTSSMAKHNCSDADLTSDCEIVCQTQTNKQTNFENSLNKNNFVSMYSNKSENKQEANLVVPEAPEEPLDSLMFVCFSCKKCFKEESSFDNHLMKHYTETNKANFTSGEGSKSTQFHCFPCNKAFGTQSSFDQHECTRHVRYKVVFESSEESSLFRDSSNQEDSLDGDYQSEDCTGDSVLLEDSLDLREVEDDLHLSDDVCDANKKVSNNCYSKQVKENTIKEMNKKGINCSICFKDNFKDHAHLKLHMRYHSKYPLNYKTCTICRKSFTCRRSLENHVSFIHKKIKTSICEICGKHLAHENQLKIHILHVHTDYRPFLCSECGLSFKRKDHLANHMNIIHTKAVLYICSHCGKQMTSKTSLLNHELYHQKCKYKCAECEEEFTSRTRLEQHKLTEHGIMSQSMELSDEVSSKKRNFSSSDMKKFKCDICNSSFRTRSYLIQHRKLHTDPKIYKCDVCGKSFIDDKRLELHKITHEKIKPHPCSHCEKSFTDKRMLKVHLLLHEGIKPYACELCGVRYSSKGNLYRHDLMKHRSETIQL